MKPQKVAHSHLVALGANPTKYDYNKPRPALLETFASPFQSQYDGALHIEVPEFTSLCPKTGQPDFAKIVIDYGPNKLCVESKSLKLYLMGFRQYGAFHEECVALIATTLKDLLDPRWLTVQGQFTPRGGIPFWPRASYKKKC